MQSSQVSNSSGTPIVQAPPMSNQLTVPNAITSGTDEFGPLHGYALNDPIQFDEVGKQAIRDIHGYRPTPQDIVKWHKAILKNHGDIGWTSQFDLSKFSVNVGSKSFMPQPEPAMLPGEAELMRFDESAPAIEKAILAICQLYFNESNIAESIVEAELLVVGVTQEEIVNMGHGIQPKLVKLWWAQNPDHPQHPDRKRAKKTFLGAKCAGSIRGGVPGYGSVEFVEVHLGTCNTWSEAKEALVKMSKEGDIQGKLQRESPDDLLRDDWVYRFGLENGQMRDNVNFPLRDDKDFIKMRCQLKDGENGTIKSVVIFQLSTKVYQDAVIRRENEKREAQAKAEKDPKYTKEEPVRLAGLSNEALHRHYTHLELLRAAQEWDDIDDFPDVTIGSPVPGPGHASSGQLDNNEGSLATKGDATTAAAAPTTTAGNASPANAAAADPKGKKKMTQEEEADFEREISRISRNRRQARADAGSPTTDTPLGSSPISGSPTAGSPTILPFTGAAARAASSPTGPHTPSARAGSPTEGGSGTNSGRPRGRPPGSFSSARKVSHGSPTRRSRRIQIANPRRSSRVAERDAEAEAVANAVAEAEAKAKEKGKGKGSPK